MGDIKLSDNFTLYEFCRTSHVDFWQENYALAIANVDKLTKLAQDLEFIRKRWGVPLIITCGVRCPEINRRVGGSPTSQHCKAEAVDFLMHGIDLSHVMEWLVASSGLRFGQAIHETKDKTVWLHYSLGEPYREASRCGMALVFRNGSYEKYA